MDFSGIPNNIIINNIFSGFYSQSLNKGSVPHLFEFSSHSYPISNFSAPYDGRLDIYTGNPSNHLAAVARQIHNITSPSFNSNITGILYYYENESIYGTCHGFDNDRSLTYYNGFNFYNAHYAGGYFAPAFGETISILKYGDEGIQALIEGVCSNLTYTEYNEVYGITSSISKTANITANDLDPGSLKQLSTPKAACPEDAVSTFFEELQLHPILGTTTQLGANNLFNSNPIPTSLDNYDIRLSSRYSTFISGDGDDAMNYVNYSGGKPIASYSANSQQNKLNNTLCLASLMETQTAIGVGTNGIQLLVVPDILNGAVGSQASFIGDDPWNFWHFQFKENTESFPFKNDYTSVSTGPVHVLGSDEGTQIFEYTLAMEDNYWVNRQCSATVDYLPWTFGASIFACPSYHFDIPYYAAINKFGFYGMRFLNNCAALSLDNTWNGVPNASELPASYNPYELFGDPSMTEPEDIDAFGSFGNFSQYDNLLAVAKQESAYSDMYAMNKGFFIWSNDQYVQTSSQFVQLANKYTTFPYTYSGLLAPFLAIFSGGISGYSQFQPNLVSKNDDGNITSSWASDVLLTNDVYMDFHKNLTSILSGHDIELWNAIESNYSFYVSDGNGGVNETFYNDLITGRDARILTRYFENTIHGNPIDLFPLNKVTFAYDKAKDYLEHTGWNRSISNIGTNSPIPDVQKRFFVGAYANGQNFSGVIDAINQLKLVNNSSFYPGFFNDNNINKDTVTPHYKSVNSGIIVDEKLRSYSPSGWLALGYAGIGQLDGNFSCFTPIFVQHPVDTVFCKIGQAPTLRTLAVDYHTIPEDKMNSRYQEIVYWTQKLKIVDSKYKNLYPLQYQWYRVPISQYDDLIKYGNFGLASQASETGAWACMEGSNSKNCTIFNPLESFPMGVLGSADNYTFIKGVTKGSDDNYKYFCLVSGRFGLRISEASTIGIEDWAEFDISFKNAVNSNTSLGMQFKVNDYRGATKVITFPTSSAAAYNGYQRDEEASVEAQVIQKIPPPNAGYGDVSALAPIGPIKYIGALRSYTPSFLNDTRGLRETWGQFLDYGTLVHFKKTLSQLEGDLLYGYSHLPICTNYQMNHGQAGVQINPTLNGYNILHWSLNQKAVASYQRTYYGVPWQNLNTFGALYPPITNKDEDYESMGVGQWQWYNNLGAIKRFGYLSDASTDDIVMIGNGSPRQGDIAGYNREIEKIKQLHIKPTYLAGTNCGYTKYGLGRNMIFYIEAFDRFYLYCDPLKKKNVQNINYMNPGIRMGNSAIQYSFLGKPNNTYLERRPMYGPYAYQWRVRKHNRDRNGNGISQGFYSMGYAAPYSEMYDAPAIYGLYPKGKSSQSYIAQVTKLADLRKAAGFPNQVVLRNYWFGTTNDEGSARNYGNTFVNCDSPNAMCDYYSALTNFAATHDFQDYACTPELIAQGKCFDPCISIRYAQGFFPGGKSQNMFGSGSPNQRVRLVPTANSHNNVVIQKDEASIVDKDVLFRSPINTPHAKMMKSRNNTVIGISPCKDGGSDHCNYITPTLHLGTSSFLEGQTSSFLALVNLMESIVGNYN
jgi:hypothetical protein